MNRKFTFIIVLCMLIFGITACGKGGDPAKEYAYVPEYAEFDVKFDYIGAAISDGDILYMLGSSWEEETGLQSTYLYQYDLLNGTNKEVQLQQGENANISQMAIGADGKLLAVVNNYEYITNDAGEIVDAKSTLELQTLSKEDGSVIESRDISGMMGNQEYAYVQHFCADGQGNLYFSNGETLIIVTDPAGNTICEIEVSNWINNMVTSKEGTVYISSYGEKGLELKPIDLNTKGLGEALAGIDGYGNLEIATGSAKSFLVSDMDTVSLYDVATGTAEELFQWLDVDVNSNYNRYVGELSDGRVWALSESYNSTESTKELVIIKKVKASEVPEKEELVYGAVYLDYNVREEIIRFNKTNAKYRIRVKDYVSDDYQAGMTQFHADLTGANCPDIIDLSAIDFSLYANKGVLEDLYPYMEKSGMKKEDYLENILGAYEVEGKLYGMMPQFYISTTMAKASNVGDVTGWTLSEMLDYAESSEAENLFSYGTRSSVFSYCIYNNIDEFINWETGECFFTGEDFIRTLEFAAKFPEEIDYNAEQEGTHAKLQNDRILLMQGSISSVQEFQMLQGMFGEEVAYVGYPNSERSGNLIYPTGGNLGMSARSKHKDGAWEFMQYLLTEEYQSSLVSEQGSSWGFPIKRSALEAKFEQDMTPEYYTDENGDQVEQMKTSWGYDDFNIDIYAATEEEVAQVRSLIASADRLAGSVNEQLVNIVTEETEAFFKGQKSAADTANVIQNRIQIYVNENR